MKYACALAQHVHRTNSRATRAQDIRIENGQRRPSQVSLCNLLDESRHIDVGRTGRHARSVEAIQAAVRLGYCGDLIERRMNFRKPCNKFRVRFVLLGRGHTTLLGDAVPILYPRAKTKAPHFSASWPHFSPLKPSPGELLPISGHFVASFYYINSSCISICSMLSFFVLSRTPFEIFDRTFPGAALPAPGPIASGLLRMQRQLSAISISNQIINLHTPYSLSC